MARARPARRTEPRRDRGAAMLIVMVTIAILSALTVDLAYETRVRLQIAANGRDELRAEALAKSGVSLSRLVLGFQQQVDQMSGQACQALGSLGQLLGQAPPAAPTAPGAPTAPTAPGAAGTSSAPCPRPQIWSVIPVSSGLVGALFGEGGGKKGADTEEAQAKVATASFGDFEGAFEAKIEDEGRKVNAQLGSLQSSGVVGPRVDALLRMTCDPRWDALFDREDATGQRWSRADLPVHLRDWVDDDATASALAVSFPAGNCSAVVPPWPFEQGFSDENFPYDRGRDRYRTKNARFDSLDELYQVAGVGDAFMAAFGDQLTVYLPDTFGMNVNTTDPRDELRIASLMADVAALPVLADPTFGEKLHKALLENPARMGGLMSITPIQFAQTLEGLGVLVKRDYLTPNPKSPFTDRSVAFRIRAAGSVGDVTRTIDAVVTYDPDKIKDPTSASTAQAQAQGGRLIHWRVE